MKIKFSIKSSGMRQDLWKENHEIINESISIIGKESVRIDSFDFFELLIWLLRVGNFRQFNNEKF